MKVITAGWVAAGYGLWICLGLSRFYRFGLMTEIRQDEQDGGDNGGMGCGGFGSSL